MVDAIGRWLARLDAAVARGPRADPVLRVGLGVVVMLAGLHKIVAPGAWAPYLAPAFADPLPVGAEAVMVFLGLTEPPFAAMLLADRGTTLAAAVVAVSIAGTVLALGVLWVQTGTGMDVLIRDLAVLALAVGVAVRSARDGVERRAASGDG